MGNIFTKLLDSWTDICDFVLGKPQDYLSATLIGVMVLPFFCAIILWIVRWWWSKASHRIAVGLMILMIFSLPVAILSCIIVIIRDKEPTLKGTKKRLKKYYSKGASYIEKYLE